MRRREDIAALAVVALAGVAIVVRLALSDSGGSTAAVASGRAITPVVTIAPPPGPVGTPATSLGPTDDDRATQALQASPGYGGQTTKGDRIISLPRGVNNVTGAAQIVHIKPAGPPLSGSQWTPPQHLLAPASVTPTAPPRTSAPPTPGAQPTVAP